MTQDEKLDLILTEQRSNKERIEFISNYVTGKFDELEKGLFGDEKFKTPGLVAQVKNNTEQINKMQSVKTWFKGWWAGAVFVISGIFWLIIEGVKLIFSGH